MSSITSFQPRRIFPKLPVPKTAGRRLRAFFIKKRLCCLRYVGLTPAEPGEIISVDMAKYDKVSARKGAYLSSLGSAEPGCELDCNPLTCCFAGFGMVRQTVKGTSGHAFLSATGTVGSSVFLTF
jgi:uncharacterized protein (AIM24 family)